MSRIILIEDDDDTRDILSDFLKDEGYDVMDYDSIDNVKDVVRFEDILIVDVKIGSNRTAGLDFIIDLRSGDPAYNRTKVIFISNFGYIMIEDMIRQLGGNFSWLDKPIAMSKLLSTIKGG